MRYATYPDPTPDYVYFIQAEGGGPVKIGRSVDPDARLERLQTSHHERLVLCAVIPNEMGALEAKLHAAFAPWHIRGEWFTPMPTMGRCGNVIVPSDAIDVPVDLPPLPAPLTKWHPLSPLDGPERAAPVLDGQRMREFRAFRGPAADASAAFKITKAGVRALRMSIKCDPETGEPWLWPDHPEAAAELALGMLVGPPAQSQRQVSLRTGIPRVTLQRMVRRATSGTRRS